MKTLSAIVGLAFTSGALAQESPVISAYLINDSSQVLDGGLERKFTNRTLGMLSAEFSVNNKLSVVVEGHLQRGKDGSRYTGDLQAYSNIDTDDFTSLAAAWVEYRFNDKVRTKIGQVDANSEFAYPNHAEEFINSSMGVSPTVISIPTYPLPRLSGNLFVNVNEKHSFGFGVYANEDNKFDDRFSILEWKMSQSDIELKLGVWHQSGNIVRLNTVNVDSPLTQRNTIGYYGNVSGTVNRNWFAGKEAGWFVQAAWSDKNVAFIHSHLGAGIQIYAPFMRENDVAGIALTHIQTSNHSAESLNDSESTLEIFYRYQINDYIALKPDIQLIMPPASAINIDDAIVATLRVEVGF